MSYEYKYICIEEILPKQYIEYWKLLWSKKNIHIMKAAKKLIQIQK